MKKILTLVSLLAFANSLAYSQSVYDEASGQLSVPSIKVGNTVYTDVVITVGEVLSVGGSYVDASAIYDLRAAYDGVITDTGSYAFQITGESQGITVTGSGSVTLGQLMAGTFEGSPAQVKGSDASFTLNAIGAESTINSSSQAYYDGNNRFLGSDGEDYEVVNAYYDLPTQVSSGDSGLIYESTLYTDSSKTTVEGINTVTYTTALDSDNTLALNVISVVRNPAGQTIRTITRRWRVFADNSVARLGETLLDETVFLTITYQ